MKKLLLLASILISNSTYAQVIPPPDPATNPTYWVRGANSTPITNQTPVAIITAVPTPTGTPAAAQRIYITDFTVSNSHASVDTDVWLQNNGVNVWPCPAAHAEGGCVENFKQPLRGAAGASWSCKSVTTGASITCGVNGYTSPN